MVEGTEVLEIENEWVSLESFDFDNEGLVLINVDTRDFHVIGATKTDAPIVEYPTRVVGIDKIKETLIRFKENSGGEREWRHFDIVGTPYSNGWDFKYLRFRKSSEGWLFINDDYDKNRRKDSAYPADYLDREGVDWVEHYYKNRPPEKEQEFQEYTPVTDDLSSYTIYSNRMGDSGYLENYPKPSQWKRETPKIQNNEPCSCGSKKKFKKCCKL